MGKHPRRDVLHVGVFNAEEDVRAELEPEPRGDPVQMRTHPVDVGVFADQQQPAAVVDKPVDRENLLGRIGFRRVLDHQHIALGEPPSIDLLLVADPRDVEILAAEPVDVRVAVRGVVPVRLGIIWPVGRLPVGMAFDERDPAAPGLPHRIEPHQKKTGEGDARKGQHRT